MGNENQGRGKNFPDSADLWNDVMLLPLHNEVSHSGIRDNGPSSFVQLQVSSSPTKTFNGETANYIGHASAGGLSSMMSNATQHSNLHLSSLHDPSKSGIFYQAQSKDATTVPALNRSRNYDLNHNVQKQDACSGIRNELHINRGLYQPESSDFKSFPALNRSQSYNLYHNLQKQDEPSSICSQLDVKRGIYHVESSDVKSFPALNRGQSYDVNHSVQKYGISPDSGGDLNILSHGSRNLVMSGAPPVDNSNLDGRFLSLGNNETAGSRWESYTSAGHYNGSKLAFPPSKLETSHSPFNPIENGACGSYPQNLVPSGTMGCSALSIYGNRTVPGSASGYVANTSLPSSGKLFDPNQLISAENGRRPIMGNHLTSRYSDTVPKAYQNIPSGLHSNNELRSSESVSSWIPRLPSEALTNSNRQQLTAEENHGLYKTSNDVSPFQSPIFLPTLGSSSKKNEHDQASQRFMHAPPSGRFNDFSVSPDNNGSSSSNKRGSSITNEPRKLIRVGPSSFQVNPSPPKSSVLPIMNLNPSTSAFTSISQQLIHQSLVSPKTAPLQNTSGNTVPAITPSSNTTNPRSIPGPQQISLSRSTYSYPNSSPASTNTSHRPLFPPWCPSPSAISPGQIGNPLNSLERHSPQFGAAGNVSLSTNFPKAVPQTSMTLPRGTSVGNMLPMFGATGNSSTRPNHKAQGSLTILPKKRPYQAVAGKALAPGPSKRTTTSESAKTIVKRFFERQTNALAAFEKNSPALHSSGTTSPMPYIKRQGVYKPEARGLKCLLCKRDLAYTPEGLVQVPACPPEVAVLPCGHVFHDHCLVAITPQDQRANPPCIPCTINEPSA